jgi:DNA-binding GntR family transcriptional regulator
MAQRSILGGVRILSNVTYLHLRHPDSPVEQAAEAIRSRILSGDLEPGEALSEPALAAKLSVGRTSVHEAILRLKAEGLVEVEPQRGTFVFDMTADRVRELSELREVLEVAAARVAIRRRAAALADALDDAVGGMLDALRNANIQRYRTLDHAYHKHIVAHAGNAFLAASYETIASRIQTLRNRLSLDPVLNRRSIRDHRKFASLVRAGEIYRASTCLSDHIRLTGTHYLRVAGLDD